LAGINYIEQQVTRCQFYLKESATSYRAPRLSSLMIGVHAAKKVVLYSGVHKIHARYFSKNR